MYLENAISEIAIINDNSTGNDLSSAARCSNCPAAAHAVIGGTTDAELRAYVGKCVDQYFYQHVDHDMDVLKDNVTNEVKNRPAAQPLGALTY